MAKEILLTPENLESEASKLLGNKSSLDGVFANIASLISGLLEHWRGEAQNAFSNSFTQKAVEAAIEEMPDDFLIKKFLIANKVEVKGMFLTEWDQEKILAQERQDSLKQGINQTNERVARDMLIDHYPISAIEKISKLSEGAIRNLAQTIGVTIM